MKGRTNTTRDTSKKKKKRKLRAILVNPWQTFIFKNTSVSMFPAFVPSVKLGATVRFANDPHTELNIKQNVQDKKKKKKPLQGNWGVRKTSVKGTLYR